MIKLIVMDMDGTLLNSLGQISELTKEELIKAQQNGVKVVLASGRSYKTLSFFGEELKIAEHDGYFIGNNGAAITSVVDMNTSITEQLQPEDIKTIFSEAKPFEVEVMGVLASSIYVHIPDSLRAIKKEYRLKKNISDDVPWTAGAFDMITDQRKGYDTIVEIESSEEIDFCVNKICIAHLPEKVSEVCDYLSGSLSHKYNFTKTTPIWLEVAPKNVSKGAALKQIMDKYNIKSDEVLAFGDGENDLSMCKVCDNFIAMGNAMDTVKAKAKAVTLDHNNDGIGIYLQNNL